jgi:hypothetical protein
MKNILMILFAGLLALAACKKGDKGDTGPVGATGATGTTGDAGTTHATATVVTIPSTGWAHIGSILAPGDGYECTVIATNITTDIASTGSVIVYWSEDTLVNWKQLPYDYAAAAGLTVHWTYSFEPAEVKVQSMFSNFATVNPGVTYGTLYLKIVAIPGHAKPVLNTIDISDYAQVEHAFHLVESSAHD